VSSRNLAPIILFAYNRPLHLSQTLEALQKNVLASESVLYIYCDGAKSGATESQLRAIEDTRRVAKQASGFKSVSIVERPHNLGLAQNIITGVTEIINQYGRIIVLEDDIVTSPGFLQYMNDALDLYADEDRVMHVSGYWFPVKGSERLPATFFYNTASCWGWGTWVNSWEKLETNTRVLYKKILKQDPMFYRFNIENSYGFSRQLLANLQGTLNTWAVKWYGTIFLENGFSLHPNHSCTNNIGHDGTGINCSGDSRYLWDKLADKIEVDEISLRESQKARKLIKKFYSPKLTLKSKVSSIFAPEIKQFIKRKFLQRDPFKIIRSLPRFQEAYMDVAGLHLKIADNASFFFMYDEIFEKEIYKFKSDKPDPLIIDGGANIGLATLYLKKLYPQARVIAFEPDPYIFDILEENINANGVKGVELINKGLWNSDTVLSFWSEGADGGRVKDNGEIKIPVVSLKRYLDEPVALLKLDIEGAETVVLEDIQDKLGMVERIFVEYHSFSKEAQSLHKVIDILSLTGYRLSIFSIDKNCISPFVKNNLKQQMDLQLNIFGFKIL
jgi:FkbM family methyltransferase